MAGGMAAFADAAARAFDRAAAGGELVVHHYRIAGGIVRIELAGGALLPFVRAFAHLEVAAAPAAFTIRVCQGVPLPAPPWDWHALAGRGEVPCDPGWAVSYLDDVLSVWRRGSVDSLVWVRDAAALSLATRGSPLLHLMHAWTRTQGRTLLHAASVAATLLVGPGGSGKSSTAMAAYRLGLPCAADDYCLVTGTTVESLYCSAKLFDRDLHEPASARDASSKALVWIEPSLSAPLRAIVVPEITGDGVVALEPISPAQALRAMAPSTLFQLPWSEAATVAALGRMVRTHPSYRLRLGRRDGAAELLARL
jgi:hypothetical protein